MRRYRGPSAAGPHERNRNSSGSALSRCSFRHTSVYSSLNQSSALFTIDLICYATAIASEPSVRHAARLISRLSARSSSSSHLFRPRRCSRRWAGSPFGRLSVRRVEAKARPVQVRPQSSTVQLDPPFPCLFARSLAIAKFGCYREISIVVTRLASLLLSALRNKRDSRFLCLLLVRDMYALARSK